MKQHMRYIAAIGLVTSLLVATPLVMADTHITTPSEPGHNATMPTETKQDTTTMKERLEKLKTDLKLKLTTAEQTRLKDRCKAAQAVVATLNTRFGKSVTTRTNAYSKLTRHLNDIIAKLKAKGVDTTKLEQQKTMLEEKINTYKADLDKYKQAISDLRDVDCVSDPTAFKAALEAARTAHATLITDTTTIRSYVVDTIKPTLHDIRTQLEANKSSNTQGGNQ